TGTLSGTNALIKYFPDGECWIFLSNTSTWKGPSLARYTANLMNELRQKYGKILPKQDLFHEKEEDIL
ncbi:MAG: serine hydrolase, partial [Bacteroidales bacterium]|nr:serine hydrolase [Bacteroidales bacterium]